MIRATLNGRRRPAALVLADTEAPTTWATPGVAAWDHERAKLRAAVEADDETEIGRASAGLKRISVNWGAKEVQGLRVLSWLEMQALPPLSFLVEDLLPEGGVSLIVGHPKAGKSTLARVLAAEVGGYGEGRFLGREIVNPGRALYYSPDEAPQMTVQHLRGILPPDATNIDFTQEGNIDQLGEVVDHEGHRLLIVDTLGRLFQDLRFPEGDNYLAWQKHLGDVRKIAEETGCHVCMLHHARKSGGDRSLSVLGSAAIAGSADTVISVTVTDDDTQYIRHVESTNRAGVELPRQRLTLAGDGWLTVAPMERPAESDAKAEVRAMRRDGQSIRQVAEATGLSRSTVQRWGR